MGVCALWQAMEGRLLARGCCEGEGVGRCGSRVAQELDLAGPVLPRAAARHRAQRKRFADTAPHAHLHCKGVPISVQFSSTGKSLS